MADKHYVIMDSDGNPIGILQRSTLRKMFSYTLRGLELNKAQEGFLPPIEKKAKEEIIKIQANHTELI